MKPPSPPRIAVRAAALGHGGNAVLRGVDLSIEPGAMIALVGPNGGGKSTLLAALAGELEPLSGTIEGRDPSVTGYLPQASGIDRRFPIRVRQVVAMGLWPRLGPFGSLRPDDLAAVGSALAAVGLSGFSQRAIGDLSGGELQRVLFARLIVLDPAIVLLDEPFAAIDEATVADLADVIRGWHDEGRTIVAALHDLDQVRSMFAEVVPVGGGTVRPFDDLGPDPRAVHRQEEATA